MAPGAARVLLALAVALALGCSGARGAGEGAARAGTEVLQGLNPLASREAIVLATSVRGPYLVTRLGGRGAELALFAPATETCAQLLAPERRVTYAKSGVFGVLEGDGLSCRAVGVASLAAWRDRSPRQSTLLANRATVRFEPIHRDDDIVLVRGRFPLVSRVGIPAGYDLVAMLPNVEECRAVIERGEGSMEFRDAGAEPYRLVSAGQLCAVLGFATPPGEPVPGAEPEPPLP